MTALEFRANVVRGDEVSADIRSMVDEFIAQSGLDAPPPELDPADVPFEGVNAMTEVRELDLDSARIRSVIWATGFAADFGYLDPSLLDDRGRPIQAEGVCAVPGLYCVGLTWLRRRVSGLVAGVAVDAEYVARRILDRRELGAPSGY